MPPSIRGVHRPPLCAFNTPLGHCVGSPYPINRRVRSMPPASLPTIVASTTCGDFHSTVIDAFLISGFFVSVLLSLLVLRAVYVEQEVVLPPARTFVAVLCLSDITLGVLAAGQMALAHVDCTLASDLYALLSSVEMFAQLLSFFCASAVAAVVAVIFWNRGAEVNLPGTRSWCTLITICCVPSSSHAILCATSRSSEVCPATCGYSHSKTSIESRLKRANQLVGAIFLLCCSAYAALCVLRVQRTTTAAVRDRHCHRLARYLGASSLLWAART